MAHRLATHAAQVETLSARVFAIILTSHAQIPALARALAEPMFIDGEEHPLEAHAGLVLANRADGELFLHARQALLSAAESGQLVWGPESGKPGGPADWELALNLPSALERGELRPYFQPQVDVLGDVVGFESLIRWVSPTWGLLSPGRFLPIIEQTRNMGKLTSLTLKEAATLSNQVGVPVAVNMSPDQMLAPNFLSTVDYVLHTYLKPGGNLEIEVTENSLIESLSLLSETVDCLRCAGVRVSIDDFGAGYSNLKLLPDLHADCLKLDRAMVESVVSCTRSRLVCRALASLAKELGMVPLAEGVETLDHLTVLQEIGFTVFQGYYFDAALPREQALQAARKGYRLKLLMV